MREWGSTKKEMEQLKKGDQANTNKDATKSNRAGARASLNVGRHPAMAWTGLTFWLKVWLSHGASTNSSSCMKPVHRGLEYKKKREQPPAVMHFKVRRKSTENPATPRMAGQGLGETEALART